MSSVVSIGKRRFGDTKWVALGTCGGVYLLSLAFPAFHWYEATNVVLETRTLHSTQAIELLFIGWLGIFDQHNPAWLANITFWIAFFLSARERATKALTWAVITIALQLFTFRLEETMWTEKVWVPIDSFGAGFYLWLTSATALVLWCVIQIQKQRRSK